MPIKNKLGPGVELLLRLGGEISERGWTLRLIQVKLVKNCTVNCQRYTENSGTKKTEVSLGILSRSEIREYDKTFGKI